LSFLTVILCGPLSHLRYQRNPRSKLSVAAGRAGFICGQNSLRGEAAACGFSLSA
jgi:hypothetical protein